MSTSSIQQSTQNKTTLMARFHKFLQVIDFAQVLRQSNAYRVRGIKLTKLVSWILLTLFQRLTLNRSATPTAFSKKTVRNFLNDRHINWQRLVSLAGRNQIAELSPFIDLRRKAALIIDDTLFKRAHSKKTELLANVYDHAAPQGQPRYVKGFRGLTIGWSDGNTFLPLNFALMSSDKAKNRVGREPQTTDQRTLAAQRYAQAKRHMNEVAVELVAQFLKTGVKASYVLFDSWYAYPKAFKQFQELGLAAVGRLKNTSKNYFKYRGRRYSVPMLFQRFKGSKYRIHDNYLYNTVVETDNEDHLRLKIVFIQNRTNKGHYIALATSKLSLTPEAVIQLYARRWQIECGFKTLKQYLQYDQTQTQSYDGLCGHVALTFLAYDLLAMIQRQENDPKTLGGIFYAANQFLADIPLLQAVKQLLFALAEHCEKTADFFIMGLCSRFINSLPNDLQEIFHSDELVS